MYPVRFPTVALTTESYFKIVKFGAVEIKIKVNVRSCVALHIITIIIIITYIVCKLVANYIVAT